MPRSHQNPENPSFADSGHVRITRPPASPYNWTDEESLSDGAELTQNTDADTAEAQTPKYPRVQYAISLFREFGVVFRELRMNPNDALLEDARKRGEAGESTIIHVRW